MRFFLRSYFAFGWQRVPFGWCCFVRTPLFAIGAYRNYPEMWTFEIFSGLRLNWIPNLPIKHGDHLYRYEKEWGKKLAFYAPGEADHSVVVIK